MKLTNEDIYTYYCKFTTMYNDPTREQFEALEKWAQNNDLAPPWEYKQSRHAHYQYEFNDDFELDR